MKVLHVITGLEAGGAEIQLAMLVRHTRHEPDVLTLYNAGSVAEQIRADGIRVRDLGMTSNTQVGALLRLRSSSRRAATTWCIRTCTGPRSTLARRPGWPGRRWS